VNLGITCYPTYGGSGIVATELGLELAERGHEIHFISYANPIRLDPGIPRIHYHEVEVSAYPLFQYPPYCLALASRMAEVAEAYELDVLHVHYAIPHSIAALLAQQMLAPKRRLPFITTLHGTDITLVGSDPGYESVVAFSIERSDGVTTVSQALKQDTIRTLRIERDIQVIPNFLDCSEWRRRSDRGLRERICGPHRLEAVLTHVSNFRPVKRVEAVFEVFRRVFTRVRTALVMIGDGPDRASLEQRVANEGLNGIVQFVGEQQDLVPWLSASDVFLLASAQESFGLAALEAMACEVPVVASRVGGLPEVIDDGVTGFLCPADAVDLMAERSLDLLTDPGKRARMGRAASERVRARFCASAIVPRYETYYGDVLAKA